MFYDRYQNAEQRKEYKFTYTIYDDLDRIVEVGEIKQSAYLKGSVKGKKKGKKNQNQFYTSYHKICQDTNDFNQFILSGTKFSESVCSTIFNGIFQSDSI